MPSYHNEDQAYAWMYWRDEDSVALVEPDGDFNFRDLRRRRERYRRRREWRNMVEGGNKSAYAYPEAIEEFVVLLKDLYAACARGEISARGYFDDGMLDIPPAEFAKGKRPEGWTDIRYSVEGMRYVFRPVDCPGPSAAPGAKEPQNAAPAPVRTAAVSATPIEANAPSGDKRAIRR